VKEDVPTDDGALSPAQLARQPPPGYGANLVYAVKSTVDDRMTSLAFAEFFLFVEVPLYRAAVGARNEPSYARCLVPGKSVSLRSRSAL
jgi:hypothetical protein